MKSSDGRHDFTDTRETPAAAAGASLQKRLGSVILPNGVSATNKHRPSSAPMRKGRSTVVDANLASALHRRPEGDHHRQQPAAQTTAKDPRHGIADASAAPVGHAQDDAEEEDSQSYRLRRLQQLSLCELRESYNDKDKGPLRPGFEFYKWLCRGPPLQVPIPDTVLIDGTDIRRLCNNAKGYIVCQTPQYSLQSVRDRFVLSCIDSFVADSTPFGRQPHMADLRSRFVAVVKRPVLQSAAVVANTVECLTPQAFHATLVDAMDSITSTAVVQKFIKCRGSRASVVRVFWRATSCGSAPSGKVAGWFLTTADKKFACYRGDREGGRGGGSGSGSGREVSGTKGAAAAVASSAGNHGTIVEASDDEGDEEQEGELEHGEGEGEGEGGLKGTAAGVRRRPHSQQEDNTGWRRKHAAALRSVQSSKQLAESFAVATEKNDQLLAEMRLHPDLTGTERSAALLHGSAANKAVSSHCIVTVAGDAGVGVTPAALAHVSCMRIGTKALALPHRYVERLVDWMQVSVQQSHDVLVHFQEVCCDFIRDESGRWWLLQLKGFSLSPQTVPRVLEWYDERNFGKTRPPRVTEEERRAQLDAERGYLCRLCGLNFIEGQTIGIEVNNAPPGRAGAAHTVVSLMGAAAAKNDAGSSSGGGSLASGGQCRTRDVPAVGYELSRRMACRLSEMYRDSSLTLTKFARGVLASETHVMEVRSVADKLRELEVLELKQSSGGELSCCFYCFQNMEEYEKVQLHCKDLHALLVSETPDSASASVSASSFAQSNQISKSLRQRPQSASASVSGPVSVSAFKASQVMGGTTAAAAAAVASSSVSRSASFADGFRLSSRARDPALIQAAAARALMASVAALYKANRLGFFADSMGSTHVISGAGAGAAEQPPVGGMYIRDTGGGFGLDMWRAKNFPQGTAQWRLLVAVHYMADVLLPDGHALSGKVGCVSYSLGRTVNTLPFINKISGGESHNRTNPIVLIQQMRMHYFCGTTADVRAFLATKQIDLAVCFQPPDDTEGSGDAAGATGPPVAAATATAAATGTANARTQKRAHRLPQLECRCRIPLSKLRIGTSEISSGGVKEDFSLPLQFESMEPALLRVSVAITRDDALPWQLADVKAFLREEDVFWPPPSYHDSAPLPALWLGMLSTQGPNPAVGALRSAVQHQSQGSSPSLDNAERGGASEHKEPHPANAIESTATAAAATTTTATVTVTVTVTAPPAAKGEPSDAADTSLRGEEGLAQARDLVKTTFVALVKQGLRAQEQERKREMEKQVEDGQNAAFSAALSRGATANHVAAHRAAQTKAAQDAGSGGSGGSEEDGSEAEDDFDFAESGAGNGKGKDKDKSAPSHAHSTPAVVVSATVKPRDGDDDDEDDKDGGSNGKGANADKDQASRSSGSGSGSSSDDDDYDYDDELPTYDILKGVFQSVREAESGTGSPGALNARGELSEGFVLLRLAVEQLLQQDYLPAACTLANFNYLLEECITWARTQRVMLRMARRVDTTGADKSGPGTMSRLRYLAGSEHDTKPSQAQAQAQAEAAAKTTNADLAAAAGGQARALGPEWVLATERLVLSYQGQFPRTDLDVGFSLGELSAGSKLKAPKSVSSSSSSSSSSSAAGAGAGIDQAGGKFDRSAPSSEARKLRRFVIALSLFESVSGGTDSADIAQLHALLQRERSLLRKTLSLAKEGGVAWPLLYKGYHQHLITPFSQERAVLALHLLRQSDSLNLLFDTYRDPGAAAVSRVGYLRAVEESFRGVTQRRVRLVTDETLEDLTAFCTERNMRAQANNTYLKGAAFTLGFKQEEDGSGGGAGELSSLAARRRMSSVSRPEVSRANEPPMLWLRCDEHGIERAYLADLMCVKCEEEHHGFHSGEQPEDAADRLAKTSGLPSASAGRGKRKSSFSFA